MFSPQFLSHSYFILFLFHFILPNIRRSHTSFRFPIITPCLGEWWTIAGDRQPDIQPTGWGLCWLLVKRLKTERRLEKRRRAEGQVGLKSHIRAYLSQTDKGELIMGSRGDSSRFCAGHNSGCKEESKGIWNRMTKKNKSSAKYIFLTKINMYSHLLNR